MQLECSGHIFESISNFTKIRPEGAKLFYGDGATDRHDKANIRYSHFCECAQDRMSCGRFPEIGGKAEHPNTCLVHACSVGNSTGMQSTEHARSLCSHLRAFAVRDCRLLRAPDIALNSLCDLKSFQCHRDVEDVFLKYILCSVKIAVSCRQTNHGI
jgi:hypothetical protein